MIAARPQQRSFFYGSVVFLYLLLSPFYIFPSGLPQFADIVLLGGMFILCIGLILNFKPAVQKSYVVLFGFIAYAAVINLLNYIHYNDGRFLFAIAFYGFNALTFVFVSIIFMRYTKQAAHWARMAIYIVIVFEIAFLIFLPEIFSRSRGTFNNPNQLSYWALLSAIMILLLRRGQPLKFTDYLALFACGFIQTEALSKAGIIMFCVLMMTAFFTQMVGKRARIIVLMAACVGVVAVIAKPSALQKLYSNATNVQSAVSRVGMIGQESDDSLEGRGYDRIWRFPEFVMLGAGEGAHYRFHPRGQNKELHSGIATLLFAYGIIGAGLFGFFLYTLFNRKPIYMLMFLMVTMGYGLTHQNLRFTHFWFVLGMVHASPHILRANQPDEGAALNDAASPRLSKVPA